MITHPVFSNLKLHSNGELYKVLGVGIEKRRTMHEWPLSCVQELQLYNGTKWIYKSQRPPTVEASFYEHARSDLLPAHRYLGKFDHCDTMILEYIDAPLLCHKGCEEKDFVEHGRQIVTEIGHIEGELPVYLDISSQDAWIDFAQMTLKNLRKLVDDGRFSLISAKAIENLKSWVQSTNTLKTVTNGSRVKHGDLKGDQVFITADGYRVIDWQRPIIAPPDVDFVSLLVSQKIDPMKYVDPEIIRIYGFLRLYWAVEAQLHLFPDQKWPLFQKWALEAINYIKNTVRL